MAGNEVCFRHQIGRMNRLGAKSPRVRQYWIDCDGTDTSCLSGAPDALTNFRSPGDMFSVAALLFGQLMEWKVLSVTCTWVLFSLTDTPVFGSNGTRRRGNFLSGKGNKGRECAIKKWRRATFPYRQATISAI